MSTADQIITAAHYLALVAAIWLALVALTWVAVVRPIVRECRRAEDEISRQSYDLRRRNAR